MIEKKELRLLAGIALGLFLWLFVGIDFFNQLAKSEGLIIAYVAFLLAYGIAFSFIGASIKKGTLFFITVIAFIIIGDIVMPPFLIPYTGATNLTPEQSLASDVFFYQIYLKFFPHKIAWILTYFATPILAFMLVAFKFSAKGTKQIIKKVFL